MPDKLEHMLKNTEEMAKAEADLVWKGTGYGAMEEHGTSVSHLKFEMQEKSLKDWKRFFETGVLHCPDPSEVPDEFIITEENLGFLKETISEKTVITGMRFIIWGLDILYLKNIKKQKKHSVNLWN